MGAIKLKRGNFVTSLFAPKLPYFSGKFRHFITDISELIPTHFPDLNKISAKDLQQKDYL